MNGFPNTKSKAKRVMRLVLGTSLLAVGLINCTPSPTLIPSVTPIIEPIPSPTSTATPIPVPSPTVPPTPSPPGIPMTVPEGPDIQVEPGQKIAIRVSAEGATRFEWELQGDGELSSSSGNAIIYTAPNMQSTAAIMSVTAYNDEGASPTKSLVIDVSLPEPTATPSPSATPTLAPSPTVTPTLPPPSPSPATAAVRLDALAIPAGWMSGGGTPGSFIGLESGVGTCYTGADCVKFTYRRGSGWGGIMWWPPACGPDGVDPASWQNAKNGTCSVNIYAISTLRTVERITFWASGAQGGEVIEFKVGATDIAPSPGRSMGRVTLQSSWQQYQLGLKGMDFTSAASLFTWIATDDSNSQDAVFYLDDIQFEGIR